MQRQGDREVHGRGRFTDAALLIRDAKHPRVIRTRHGDLAARVEDLHSSQRFHGERRIVLILARRFT
jgi:hypothetical protein